MIDQAQSCRAAGDTGYETLTPPPGENDRERVLHGQIFGRHRANDDNSPRFSAGEAQRIRRRCEKPDASAPNRPHWFVPAQGWPTIGEFALLTNIPVWRWAAVLEGGATIDLDMAIALSLYWKAPVQRFLELEDNAE